MKQLRYILPFLICLLLLAGCRSTSSLRRKHKDKIEKQESEQLVHSLLTYPDVTELSASLSLGLNGNKVNGQLRMRRGRSIQISASILGLMEVARIEFLPDMVVVMDRVHNLYSVCHYADIPYRNELGLDFDVVQSILWNRVFSPGFTDESDAASRLLVQKTDDKERCLISDLECGYLFQTDGKSRLDAVSKRAQDFSFKLNYSRFNAVSDNFLYPSELSFDIDVPSNSVTISVNLSSVSTENKNWSDRTQVSRRMKQVSLDELLDYLNL